MTLSKKKILLLYEFFYPGYKSGGPVQSLLNMTKNLSKEYYFKIATTAFDLHDQMPYKDLILDCWTDLKLNEGADVKVWYSSQKKPSIFEIQKVIKSSRADIIYINGFYTNHFLFPLILNKIGLVGEKKIIISPRGMLQKGALKNKSLIKQFYLYFLKLTGLMKHVHFHATTEDEINDIKKIFGKNIKAVIAGNIPKRPLINLVSANKNVGELRLVYLSLISEKKNLLLLLKELTLVKSKISLDIYGPIKDEQYWLKCKEEIDKLPNNISVSYKGDIHPDKVQATIGEYHAFLLLTSGENFGHAIYESLSVGTPVIISNKTPWKFEATSNPPGWIVNLEKDEESQHADLKEVLIKLYNMDNETFSLSSKAAHEYAIDFYQSQDFKKQYTDLFNSFDH